MSLLVACGSEAEDVATSWDSVGNDSNAVIEPETGVPAELDNELAVGESAAQVGDATEIIKFISNLQPGIPDPIPPKKVQLDWLIHGSGGEDIVGRTNEEGELAPLHESVTGQFSYHFTSGDGEIAGRVEGDNGEIRIFALGSDGTYALIRYENGVFYRNGEGDAYAYDYEVATYEFAIQFVRYFASMTRAGHDHSYAPLPYNLGALAPERFPVDFRPIDGDPANIVVGNNLHVENRETDEFIVFFYEGQDVGGMMNAMWLDGTVKWVSNLYPSLQPSLQPDQPATAPPKKVQIDWLIHGAGGEDIAGRTDEDGGISPLHESVTGQFSYQFTSEDGEIRGRVEGDNGEIRIFALRANGTYALIRYVNGTFFRGATDDNEAYEDEIAAYRLAVQFVDHFVAMTGVGHTRTFPHPHSVLPTKDLPIYLGADKMITFGYDGQDEGGMMRAIILPVQ